MQKRGPQDHQTLQERNAQDLQAMQERDPQVMGSLPFTFTSPQKNSAMETEVLQRLLNEFRTSHPDAWIDAHNSQITFQPRNSQVSLSLRLVQVSRNGVEYPVVFNLWINRTIQKGKIEFREWLRKQFADWYFCDNGIVDFDPPKERNVDYGNAAVFSPGCSWIDDGIVNVRRIVAALNRLDEKLRSINAYDFQPTGKIPASCNELERDVVESEISEMRDIPVVSYPEDVVESSNLDNPVLSWVTTVADLFGCNPIELQDKRKLKPGKYVIPAYQRKYAWEARQIGQLCRDLLHAENASPNGSYHLGTLIFHRDAEKDFFYVVDGQQRLTTISRILGQRIFHSRSDQQFTEKDARLIDEELRKFVEADRNKIRSALERCTFVCIAVTDITESFQLFSTQNGRGKPLSPVNLLKAFHFHEVGKLSGTALAIDEERCRKIDEEWESLSNEKTSPDGRLLSQVIGEHLYRLRNWCRGVFPEIGFSNASIDEFKGLTADFTGGAKVPLQNLAVLRHRFSSEQMGKNKAFEANLLAKRAENDGMNPFVSVDQPIINGEDFFEYAISYAKAYDFLFRHGTGMEEFRSFHMEKCLRYRGSGRRGDTYARHVFESLALFCFDRFGKSGLVACMRELYCCAYFERLVKFRCYYSTCGSEFSIKAVRCMLRSMTLPDLKDRLQDLCLEVREKVRERFENDRNAQLTDGLETVKSVFEGK